jgi:hypothetical protein
MTVAFQIEQRRYSAANQGSAIRAGCVSWNKRATIAVPAIFATMIVVTPSVE